MFQQACAFLIDKKIEGATFKRQNFEINRNRNMDFKKGLLWTGLGAIMVSSLITIGIFLFGSMDETQVRLILTTFAVGVYSLTGFGASSWKEKRFAPLGYVGLAASVFAMIMAMRFIWDKNWSWSEEDVKFTVILNIIAFAAAYSSLLLRAIEARTTTSSPRPL